MDTPATHPNTPVPDPSESDQIEQELAQAMAGHDVEQLMAQQAAGAVPPPTTTGDTQAREKDRPAIGGNLVRGRVAAVHGDDVFVDLPGMGGKNQGVVPLMQFDRPPRVGSIMDFVVQGQDASQGLTMLSREGAVGRATWDQLRKGMTVEARVVATNKGGLTLEIVGGIEAFIPASQVDLHYVEDLQPFVGQKLKANVQEINHRSQRVVLNRRGYLEAQRQAQQSQLWEQLEVGQSREGTVSGITEYGVFVDLGGLDGLVHVSDISHSRVKKPADVVKPGQTVTVKVLKIDREKQRVSLGMKQAEPDPWLGIDQRLHVGDAISARVVRVVDFGAFVEVEPGIEGLVPISELSWKRVHRPSEVVKDGDVLKLSVLRVELDKRRISLSLKQAQGDPWTGAEQKYEKGGLVNATVVSVTEFGAFVEIEQGVEGLVHISELADRRVDRVEDVLQVGQNHQLRVLEIDPEQRRVRLSLKAVKNYNPDQGKASAAGADARKKSPPARKKPSKPLKGGIE